MRDFTESDMNSLGYQIIVYEHWIYEGQMKQTYETLIF